MKIAVCLKHVVTRDGAVRANESTPKHAPLSPAQSLGVS